MIRILGFLLCAAFFMASCRSAKKIQSAITKKDSVAVVEPVKDAHADSMAFIADRFSKLEKNRISFETFSAKINVDYQGSDGKKYDVNAFVRMKKDSIIWISVNAVLGIEAMRIMIDKDSVRLINKLDKEYQARSMEYLQEVANLPLDLNSMQNLIIGNPVFFDSASIASYSMNGENISLLSFGTWFRHLLTISGSSYVMLDSKLDDVDPLRTRTAYLNYGAYETKNGFYFPTSRIISITEKSKLDVKLHFKQYEFNEMLSFPFSVPRNYTRKS